MSDEVPPIPYGLFYDPPPTVSTKDPYDVITYVIDFTEVLQPTGDVLVSVTEVTYSPGDGVLPDLASNASPYITSSPLSNTLAQAVAIPIKGGIVPVVYAVSAYVATLQGNSLKRSMFVPVGSL